jgi:hypothetical protein
MIFDDLDVYVKLVHNLTDDAYVEYINSRIDDQRTFNYTYYVNQLGGNDKGKKTLAL